MIPQAAVAPSYQPRTPWITNPIWQVLSDHFYSYLHSPDGVGATDLQFNAISDFIRCGDPRFGFTLLACRFCNIKRKVAFSCATRNICPSCDKKRAVMGAEHIINKYITSGTYRTMTITIPKWLRVYFEREDRGIKKFLDLCRQSMQVYLKRSGFDPKTHSVTAIVHVHEFGNFLNSHIHAHLLVKDELFTKSGADHTHQWDRDILLEALRNTFISKLHDVGFLTAEGKTSLESWEHSGFNVKISDVVAEPNIRKTLEYLFRPAYSAKRIRYDGRRVTILPTAKSKQTAVILSPHDTIARLLKLVRPARIHVRRAWGEFAHVSRAKLHPKPLDEEADEYHGRRPMWRDQIQRLCKVDPMKCPKCREIMSKQVIDNNVTKQARLHGVSLPDHPIPDFKVNDLGFTPHDDIVPDHEDEVNPIPDLDQVDPPWQDDVPIVDVNEVGEKNPRAPPKVKEDLILSSLPKDKLLSKLRQTIEDLQRH